MTLIPYDPFQLIRREFGSFPALPRVFDDDWFDGLGGAPRLRVDIHETASEVIVSAELPGLEKKEDVSITVHDNHLHLSGKIERSGEQKHESYHRTERFYGQFTRTIPLPTAVDDASATATYRNGILEIRLQKAVVQTGRQIEIDFQ